VQARDGRDHAIELADRAPCARPRSSDLRVEVGSGALEAEHAVGEVLVEDRSDDLEQLPPAEAH
jgi:hypothetical protein